MVLKGYGMEPLEFKWKVIDRNYCTYVIHVHILGIL